MLGDHGTRELVDWEVMSEAFPGVDFEGGVCYFLWDRTYSGPAKVKTIRGDSVTESNRMLDEFDVFVRDAQAVDVLRKVLAHGEASISDILTNTEPFKYESNFTGYHLKKRSGDLPLYMINKGKRTVGYIGRNEIAKNAHLIDTWKVLVGRGYGERGARPARVLGQPWIAPSPSVCTGSFMFFYVGSEAEAQSLETYFATKFFRFLVSLRKITQNAFRSTYKWVPQQSWDRTWTDKALYKKYCLSQGQIEHIETVIKPISLGGEDE
jgi:site-specific DNA-methyltransferase (adenine-specific)